MSTETQHLGKYELRERLGQGSMAEVWKAFDTQLHRYVAIKILHANLQNDPDFLRRFEREARVIASLHHPNIVQIYDFQVSRPPESDNTIAYMVVDYIEGKTLTDYIRRTSHTGKFPPISDILHIFTAVSTAVDYAHQRGMIHRDIKPGNILLDQRNTSQSPIGEPVLTDFDVAKLLVGVSGTLSGMWMGTSLYISPEQAQGQPGNERSDIYSLGVILYELCTGVPPFQGKSPTDVMMQHIHATPPPPELVNRHIPSALSAVILRSLAKDPMARFASASAMATALAQALNMPIPESLTLSSFPLDQAAETTSSGSSVRILSSSNATPSLPTPPTPSAAPLTPRLVTPVSGGNVTPVTSVGSRSSAPTAHSAQVSSLSTSTTHVSPPPTPPTPARKRRRSLLALLVLLLLLIVISSMGTLFVLSHSNSASPIVASQIVGYAYFDSSGQFVESSTNGINDELHLIFHSIARPTPGKSYYFWLLSDNNQKPTTFIALGAVQVNHGHVDATYTTPQHTNLIATTSRLLITEESTSPAPSRFSTDHRTWRYYAEIPQTYISRVNPKVNTLTFLRFLMFEINRLMAQGLHGGSTIRLLRNTQKVLEWAGSARDEWDLHNIALMHRHFIRILDYLDGLSYVRADVPPGTPILINPSLAQNGLVIVVPKHRPEPYAHLVAAAVLGVVNAPDVSPEKHLLAVEVEKDVRVNVEHWLQLTRQDAKQLVVMTDAQLAQRSTLPLLNDLVTQARYAYSGQLDPNTGQLQGGALLDYYNIERLASFDIVPYMSK